MVLVVYFVLDDLLDVLDLLHGLLNVLDLLDVLLGHVEQAGLVEFGVDLNDHAARAEGVPLLD